MLGISAELGYECVELLVMKRLLPWLIAVLLVGGWWWVFPPFRVHSVKAVRQAQAGQQFNAAEFVSRFWAEKLLPATAKATEVDQASCLK